MFIVLETTQSKDIYIYTRKGDICLQQTMKPVNTAWLQATLFTDLHS